MKMFHKHTTIIYCSAKNTVEEVAKLLEKIYPGEVVACHSRNKKGEHGMLLGRKHIIIATSALAMGVSIKNVDLVIHYNMPLSISDYYQMSGRAGREGQKARSILIYNNSDYCSNHFAGQGVKLCISRYKGKPWGLLVIVHPTLVLGDDDRSAFSALRHNNAPSMFDNVFSLSLIEGTYQKILSFSIFRPIPRK